MSRRQTGRKPSLYTIQSRFTDRTHPSGKKCWLKYTLTVANNSYLHVGSGETGYDPSRLKETREYVKKTPTSEIDLELFEIPRGIGQVAYFNRRNDEPIIPASTIKGSLRSRIELLFAPHNNEIPACFVIQSHRIDERSAWRHLKLYGYLSDRKETIPQRFQCRRLPNVCVVCDIFGTMGLRGLVQFSDAAPVSKVQTQQIQQRIGGLIEVVGPGTKFSGEIYGVKLSDSRIGLLLKGMGILDNQHILMGLSRYRRVNTDTGSLIFGHVQFSLDNAFINGHEVQISNLIKHAREAVNSEFGKYLRDINEAEVAPL